MFIGIRDPCDNVNFCGMIKKIKFWRATSRSASSRPEVRKQAQTTVTSLLKIILLSVALACIYLQQRKHVFSFIIRDLNMHASCMQ